MSSKFAIPILLYPNDLDLLRLSIQKFKNPLFISSNHNFFWIKQNLESVHQKIDNIILVASHEGLVSLMKKFEKIGYRDFDALVCVGGGSVMDFGKIVRSLISTRLNYDFRDLEISSFIDFLNSNQSRNNFPYLISIPTTTGTGSEVTSFSTIWDYEKKIKYSFDCQYQASDEIYFIPELTRSLPQDIRLSTLLDALSHGFESLWSKRSNVVSELYANFSIYTILKLLDKEFSLWVDSDYEQSMYAAYVSGLAISLTKTGVCHSLSYPLTLNYGVLHGLACSFTLPFVVEKIQREGLQINFDFQRYGKIHNLYDLSLYLKTLFNKRGINNIISARINDRKVAETLILSYKANERSGNSIVDFTDEEILLISRAI